MPSSFIIPSAKHEDIINVLLEHAKDGANFTNGTYMFGKDIVVPTTLAGFKFISSINRNNLPFVIAINSDRSLKALGKEDFEPQLERAKKITIPLSEYFPERKIFIIFFDEITPTELYRKLSSHGLTATHHKWGYGTSPDEPKIEGAEFFKLVFGLPLPGDLKPVCYYDTPKPDSFQQVIVADLRDKLISADRRLLFDKPVKLCKSLPSLGWREIVRYMETEKDRASIGGDVIASAHYQEQLDRLGGLVPKSR